ncbi:hypothetical protein BJ875DRAFT_235859 [Amylocarpus encephaloides]|uniref:Extracellular membrane protein CFEM domain-containing protein n=1 Tax=Amylocarpus encephaloides TaxID=45428 RepID=A0A9P7YME5_9HELO|nr:hypothetical protein BJ875DRAFT_235859 [Amylocarpus encephaloides]
MFPSQTTSSILLLVLTTLTPTHAQEADGTIVPFTTQLPACASKCGPLFDVQGGCQTPSAYQTCFCGDARLSTFATGGTAAVSAVCGAASCTDTADLTKVETWYKGFCGGNKAATGTSTTAAAGTGTATAGGSGSATTSGTTTNPESAAPVKHGSWFQNHWKWVVMLVVLIIVIAGSWVGACIWRRAYLRKKERAFELRPPAVPWGPNQEQNMVGGFGPPVMAGAKGRGLEQVYGPGVGMTGANPVPPSPLGPGRDPEKAGKMGWLRKNRS